MGSCVKFLGIFFLSTLLSSCGFHFKTGELLPPELRTMQFKTADKYSDMSRHMRQTLRLNGITLVENNPNVPVFYLGSSSRNDQVTALFATGKEAENVMTIEVSATVTLPNGETYPLSTRVAQYFFDSPQEALAKTTEKETIWQQMEKRATEQLIHRLFALKDKLQKTTP